MSRVAVVGVGSPHGNDRVGWDVIADLEKRRGSRLGKGRRGRGKASGLQGALALPAFPSSRPATLPRPRRLRPVAPDWQGQVALHRLDRPATALLTALAGAELGVVVDAARVEAAPGTVVRITDPDALGPATPLSSHGLGVAEALALGRTLGELPPRLVLLGVALPPDGQPFPEGTVAAARAAVVAEVDAHLARGGGSG